MPEMSSYYHTWIAQGGTQASGLSTIYLIALSLMAAWYAVRILPAAWRARAKVAVEAYIGLMIVIFTVVLMRTVQ